MRACRVDTNHKEICDALVAAGAAVQNTSKLGNGCPDAFVSFRGVNYAMEFKHGKGKPNEMQKKWHIAWQAPVHVVYSAEEALRVIGVAA